MQAHAKEEFIISRVFEAPRELVFDAWTRKEHLDRWFGPKGCQIVGGNLDLRDGGTYHYGMRMPDGNVMWGKWTFREVRRPEKLVLISSFSDEQGGITVHPGSPNWPRLTLSTTTFEPQGPRTLLTIRWEPYQATDIERRTFAENHASMNGGWSGTFEQLASYLAEMVRKTG
jgi:uncharacterized protein YndB with AHSA1/START domain